MKKALLISTLAAGLLTMTGCGSSDDSGTTSGDTTTTLSAQFIDSAVQGLGYDCQSSGNKGVTDDEGRFNYVAGDTCTFSVGTVTVGSGQPSSDIFTPNDLSTDPEVVTHILQLLQTLDTDGNPDNGITLPTGITGTVDLGTNFDADIQTFLTVNEVTNPLVTAEDANAHHEESMTKDISDADFIGKTYTYHGDVEVAISFDSEHNYVGTGDNGTTGSWSIVENKLVLVDTLGTTTFTFLLTGLVNTLFEDIGEAPRTAEGGTFTVTDTPSEPVDEIDLTGTWMWIASGYDANKTLLFTDSTLIETQKSGTPYDSTLTSTYSYNFTGTSSQPSVNATVKTIDLTTTNALLTLHSQDTVDTYNDASYLGFNDWALNVTKDVSSIYNGSVRKEFVYVENNILTLTISAPNSSDYPESLDNALPYTKQSDTPVDQELITLTDDMFNGMTYTYGESGTTSNQITTSFTSDGTFTSTGDGDSSGTWTITDNKLVLTDSIGTTTIEFISDTIAHAIAQDIGQPVNDMGEMPYTSTVTPTDGGSIAKSSEPLRSVIGPWETTYTYNDTVVVASSVYENNTSNPDNYSTTTTYLTTNRELMKSLSYQYPDYHLLYNLTYNSNNEISKLEVFIDGTLKQESNYAYDSQNRITEESLIDESGNTFRTRTFLTYDLHDNVTEVHNSDYDSNEIFTYTYYASGNLETETSVDQNSGDTHTTTYIDVTILRAQRLFNRTDRFVLTSTTDYTGDGSIDDSRVQTYDAQNRLITSCYDSDLDGVCNNDGTTTYFYE